MAGVEAWGPVSDRDREAGTEDHGQGEKEGASSWSGTADRQEE
jgi:hypothetical protein